MPKCFSLFCLLFSFLFLPSQSVQFAEQGHFYFGGLLPYSALDVHFHRLGPPFLYAACKELGVVTFDISNPSNPTPVDTLLPSQFGGLKPTSITQDGNLLLVSLGEFQSPFFDQRPGLAILDISAPEQPSVVGQWDSTAWNKGASFLVARDGMAYLAAMESGIIGVDYSSPSNPAFACHLSLDNAFGNPSHTPAARGLSLSGNTLFVTNDAGGMRAVDISSPSSPSEIGKFLNPQLQQQAYTFYNNVVTMGNYAYIPLDYCGLQVVNISDPAQMSFTSWLDLWNCDSTNWAMRPGHANQISFIPSDSIVLISGNDTEVLAIDARDPASPILLGQFGAVGDSMGSWGVDVWAGKVAVSLLHFEVDSLPVYTKVGGVRLLDYQFITGRNHQVETVEFQIFPNPGSEKMVVEWKEATPTGIQFFSLQGILLKEIDLDQGLHRVEITSEGLPSGTYFVRLTNGRQGATRIWEKQ